MVNFNIEFNVDAFYWYCCSAARSPVILAKSLRRWHTKPMKTQAVSRIESFMDGQCEWLTSGRRHIMSWTEEGCLFRETRQRNGVALLAFHGDNGIAAGASLSASIGCPITQHDISVRSWRCEVAPDTVIYMYNYYRFHINNNKTTIA